MFGNGTDYSGIVDQTGLAGNLSADPMFVSAPQDDYRISIHNGNTVPVAVLSAEGFDATTVVDRTSLTFGRTGNEQSLVGRDRNSADVNRDGRRDLLCRFSVQLAGFQLGDTEGILKGKTVDGVPLEGRDSVQIIS